MWRSFVLALAPAIAFTQTFEVASIKPAAGQEMGRFRISMGGDPGRVDYQGVPLRMLIERAYSIKPYQLSGPAWIDSERFDVAAKIPDGAKQTDVPKMLQALLAERFKMITHNEQKTLPIYALVVGKSGPKLKETTDPSRAGQVNMQMGAKGRQISAKFDMDAFVGMLSRMLDRPVVDATELKGTYEIALEWMPDESERGMMGAVRMPLPGGGGGAGVAVGGEGRSSESNDSHAPNLFAALQEQLGLKLEPRKGPVDVVVVDSIEKTPTQN